ncbi:MAG: serine/threonine protein kinase [Bradymonadaceae bacterium]|nr:serine/threonine protein kinase [Lujinxingiaceae bacterium]
MSRPAKPSQHHPSFPKPGEIFEGRYRIVAPIGSGGFAQVYHAVQVDLERNVALKVLTPGLAQNSGTAEYSETLVQRFHQEARMVSKLHDPHTITMYDYGRTDKGLLYMVFEFVNGVSLAQLIRRDGPIAADRVIKVLKQTLLSLQEAHVMGVLHRDIKPANIMIYDHVGRPDQVKLLDFGIAKLLTDAQGPIQDLTAEGAMVGTPRYMSPEQILGKTLTPASDLYSLGLVAFEMIVGKKANDNNSTMTIIGRQLDPLPFVLPPQLLIAPGLRRIIERMLKKDIDQRPRSADEALAALEFVNDETTPDIDSPLRRVARIDELVPTLETSLGGLPDASQRATRQEKPALGDPTSTLRESAPIQLRTDIVALGSDTAPAVRRNVQTAPKRKSRRREALAGTAFAAILLLVAANLFGFFDPDDNDANPSVVADLAHAQSAEGDEALLDGEPEMLIVDTRPHGLRISFDGVEVGVSPMTVNLSGVRFPVAVTAQLNDRIERSIVLQRPSPRVLVDFGEIYDSHDEVEIEAHVEDHEHVPAIDGVSQKPLPAKKKSTRPPPRKSSNKASSTTESGDPMRLPALDGAQ